MDTKTEAGPTIGVLHEVRGVFDDSERMSDAVGQLSVAGFDRADLSLPEAAPPPERSTPESGAKPADSDEDATVARTLHTSGAASVAALAAAGITIATGGAAAVAGVAAVAAGAVAGGATFAVTNAADESEQQDRDVKAASGELILSVRAPTLEKMAEAEGILRAAGAIDIREV